MGTISENVARVHDRIAAACGRSGRRPEEVKLLAVSKTVSPEFIRQAYEAGVRDFGENRVQEAAAKLPELKDLSATWHLVGHLQTNKARHARELFQWVHSVDSAKLAEKLNQVSAGSSEKLKVLLQVNLGEEPTKFGAGEEEVLRLAERIGSLENLELRGLMTLPPFFDDLERVRPFFRHLRELTHRIESQKLSKVSMAELSMGMTHDFEVAVEEGATIVRVGTAIFGERG